LITKEDALELLVKEYEEKGHKGMAIGPYGVILGKNNLYFPKNVLAKGLQKLGSTGIPKHLSFPQKCVKVDIIKGRMIFFKKDELNNIPILPEGPSSFVLCDDIVINAHLAHGALGHHLVTNKLNGKIQLDYGKAILIGKKCAMKLHNIILKKNIKELILLNWLHYNNFRSPLR
jgi:hypothetical protein